MHHVPDGHDMSFGCYATSEATLGGIRRTQNPQDSVLQRSMSAVHSVSRSTRGIAASSGLFIFLARHDRQTVHGSGNIPDRPGHKSARLSVLQQHVGPSYFQSNLHLQNQPIVNIFSPHHLPGSAELPCKRWHRRYYRPDPRPIYGCPSKR